MQFWFGYEVGLLEPEEFARRGYSLASFTNDDIVERGFVFGVLEREQVFQKRAVFVREAQPRIIEGDYKRQLVDAVRAMFQENALYQVDAAANRLRRYFGSELHNESATELTNAEIAEILQTAGVQRVMEDGVAFYCRPEPGVEIFEAENGEEHFARTEPAA